MSYLGELKGPLLSFRVLELRLGFMRKMTRKKLKENEREKGRRQRVIFGWDGGPCF